MSPERFPFEKGPEKGPVGPDRKEPCPMCNPANAGPRRGLVKDAKTGEWKRCQFPGCSEGYIRNR